jgi:hypothetical protein
MRRAKPKRRPKLAGAQRWPEDAVPEILQAPAAKDILATLVN